MKHKEELDFNIINNNFPYEILLLADETKDVIDKYLFDSIVYEVAKNREIIAVFCLFEVDKNTVELKNIAVIEKYQNHGIGSKIVSFIKEICKEKYSKIIVGTADYGISQINFYKKNGFKEYGVRENFFIENYAEPIYVNGFQLKDMVLLKHNL